MENAAVASFYFDRPEREPTFEDHAGIEPADLDAARQEAVRSAKAVVGAEAPEGELCVGCRVDVVNMAGTIVATVPIREVVRIKAE